MHDKEVSVTVDVLQEQIGALRDAAARSIDPCLTAKFIALSDKRVQETLSKKLIEQGHVLRSIECLDRIEIPENKCFYFNIDCKPSTFCLVKPAFLVVVNIVDGYVVAIVDPFIPTQTNLKGPGGLPILNAPCVGPSRSVLETRRDFVCEDHFSPDRRTEVRIYCKYVVGVKVRTFAAIHFPEEVASRIEKGFSQAPVETISTALASTGAGAPAAAWTALAGALVAIGYNTLKNSDGSLDLRVRTASAYYWFEPTGNDIAFYHDPIICTAMLNAL